MSGIFVEDTDTFFIVVCYEENDKEIKILESNQTGGKSLKVTFKYPDFATSQTVLNASMIQGSNGELNLNMLRLNSNILYMLAKSWDAKDAKGNPIPIADGINKLRIEIAKALIEKLVERLGTNII